MAKYDETPIGLYLVSIVGIVAVFGLVVLVMDTGSSSTQSYDDLTGQAYDSSWWHRILTDEDDTSDGDEEEGDTDEEQELDEEGYVKIESYTKPYKEPPKKELVVITSDD